MHLQFLFLFLVDTTEAEEPAKTEDAKKENNI